MNEDRKKNSGRGKEFVERFTLSDHAAYRANQRGLHTRDIRYVLRYGKQYRAANAIIYYLRRVDIPSDELKFRDRLEGTAVITATGKTSVITVWRNRQKGIRNIRRKLNQFWYRESMLLEELV